MSEEAISESDLEESLNSEDERFNEDEKEEDNEDQEDDEDENDGDDEDDGVGKCHKFFHKNNKDCSLVVFFISYRSSSYFKTWPKLLCLIPSDRPTSAQDGRDSPSATSEETSSQPPSRPTSRPSSEAPSRPASGSQPTNSPESLNQKKRHSGKAKKQKGYKLTKSSRSSKSPNPSKPTHMRKNIRYFTFLDDFIFVG